MSNLWRRKNGITYTDGKPQLAPQADDTNVYEGYLAYDPSASDNNVMLPIGTDDYLYPIAPQIPGQREQFHPMAADIGPLNPSNLPYIENIRDNIDWEFGGVHGLAGAVPFSTGVVSSDLVENFALTGEMAIIRREASPHMPGAVGTADSSALLAISYAQAAAQYWPGEAAQGDLVRSV